MKHNIVFLAISLFFFVLKPAPVYARAFGDGVISLYNLHLDEKITVRYRSADGAYDEQAIEGIKKTLRCRMTHQVHDIPLELIELVDSIQDHFHAETIHVISGFRSPSLNASLRNAGRAVAKNSFHLQSKAMDIRLPGVSTRDVREYALSLKRGGVGYYPGNDFVHVDVGPVRRW